MNGDHPDYLQEPSRYFSQVNSSSSMDSERVRLKINGFSSNDNQLGSQGIGSPYANGISEPNSSGGCSTTSTTSETKKQGKFKFLTIPSANDAASENLNSSGSDHDVFRHPSPFDEAFSRTSPSRRIPLSAPVSLRRPSFSIRNIQNFPSLDNKSSDPEYNTFGIPGPLPTLSSSPRKTNPEDALIDMKVQLLLAANPMPDANVEVDDQEDDDDSDFDMRLEEMIAQESRPKKRGRKKNSTRGGLAARGGKRRSPRGRTKKEEEQSKIEETVLRVLDVPVENGRSPIVADKLTESPVLPSKNSRGRKASMTSKKTNAISTPLPVSSTTFSAAEPVNASDDNASQFSSSEVESRENDDISNNIGSPRKLKSRWAEKISALPPPISEGKPSLPLYVHPFNNFQSPLLPRKSPEKEILSVDFAAPGEEPPSYEKITECIRLSKQQYREDREARKMRCECTFTAEDDILGLQGCGSDCMNRLMYIECTKCSAGDRCSNKRFQRREYVPLEVFKTEKKGWGIKAKSNIRQGQFICEYVGEILDEKQFSKRKKLYEGKGLEHHYFMALNNEEVIDATAKGNYTRFTNHSCDPNAETQKWTVNGQLRIGFFALRPISAGEEITFDYQFERYGQEAQICYCGSIKCRKTIGSVGDEKKKTASSKSDSLTDRKVASEIDRFAQLGSIRTSDQALRLARLMLRVERDDDRLVLLRVLQNSSDNIDSLRSFLKYNGLALMADAMFCCRDSSAEAKIEILKSLRILPIVAKNALIDTKIWSYVEKWAGRETGKNSSLPPLTSNAKELHREESNELIKVKLEPHDPFNSKLDVSTGVPKRIKSEPDLVDMDQASKESPDDKDEEPNDAEKTHVSTDEEEALLKETATDLLKQWEHLKILFRIPKRTAEQLAEDAKVQALKPPDIFLKKTEAGATIPALLPGWSRKQHHRSPSPPNQAPNHKRSKYFNNRFDGYPKRYTQDERPVAVDQPSYDQPSYYVNQMDFGMLPTPQFVQPFQPCTSDPVPLQPFNEPYLNFNPVEVAAMMEEAKVMEQIQRNKDLASQQVSQRLLTNQISATQKVVIMLKDGSLHDARTFRPTLEQVEQIRRSLPDTTTKEWKDKAEYVSTKTGGMVVEPLDAPVGREFNGWTCNFDLTKITHLPKDWAPAYDRVGRLYFYNTLTGVSRWDYPTEDRVYTSALHQISGNLSVPSDLENVSLVPEGSVDLNAWIRSIKLPEDEQKRGTNSKLSPEEHSRNMKLKMQTVLRKRKIDFKNDVCQYILHILSAYRDPRCGQGRIENKEDFKFLARKFTNTVVEQEIQRHRKTPEALSFSSRHKPKIKEHIKKYMSRFGKVYRRDSTRPEPEDTPKDDLPRVSGNGNLGDEDEEDEETGEITINDTPEGNSIFSPEMNRPNPADVDGGLSHSQLESIPSVTKNSPHDNDVESPETRRTDDEIMENRNDDEEGSPSCPKDSLMSV